MNNLNNHDSNLIQNLITKYEMNVDFANRLQYLYGFKIVFILDDSGSMNSELDDSPLNNPLSQRVTRWNELEYFASIALEIANFFDQNGCDVYFLNNQPPIKNIKNIPDFLNNFRQIKPGGYTPLTKTLNQVLLDNANIVCYEKKLLIIIVTDGEPTDQTGKIDIEGFYKCLLSRKPKDRIFTNIIACTDEEKSIDYLNKWDKIIFNLDVVDDFRTEKKQIEKIKGPNFRFNYGDYVVKCLLGSVDKTLDNFDEAKKDKCKIQ